MDGSEMRARRKALGKSQAVFAEELGLSRDHVGRMERGEDAILTRTAAAVRALKPAGFELRKPKSSDPMERLIEAALIDARIRYTTDEGGGTESRLDFRLPDYDIELEVKRFYSARTGEQMARAPNVIVAQGEAAVRFLAAAIRSGDFFEIAAANAVENNAVRVEACEVGEQFGIFVTSPGKGGRKHVLQRELYETILDADAAAKAYAQATPGVRYVRPRTKGAQLGPQF